jgi:chromate transport protein ChrA
MNTQPSTKITPEERRVVVLVHSAIAGGSIAAVLELAARETWTMLQLIALGCFAVAVPTAIAMVILSRVLLVLEGPTDLAAGGEGQSLPALSYVLAASDQVACYLGFLALFWHFQWIVGTIFLLATVFAMYVTWMTDIKLRRKDDLAVTQSTIKISNRTNKRRTK